MLYRLLAALTAVLFLLSAPPVGADPTFYWDGGTTDIGTNGDGASQGGDGTWDLTTLNWDAGAAPHTAWDNASNATAVFGGAAGTVTLGTAITVGGLTFGTAGYTLNGDTLTFGAPGSIVTNADATISSSIAGSVAIAKTGTGTLTLSGANSFTGALTLSGGTLQANTSASALGTGAATLVLTGGILDFNHSAALNFGRNTTVGANATIVSEKDAAGAGVTYTLGTLSIGASTLNVRGGNVTSGTAGLTFGATTLSGAATFNVTNPAGGGTTLLTVGAVDTGGNLLSVTGTGNTTLSGVVSNGGGITKSGAGILTLSGTNTFTGPLTVQSGTLSIPSINNASANGTLGNSALPVVLGSSGQTGTLRYTGGSASSTKPFTLASGGMAAFEVTTAATTLTLSGMINGGGGLTKTGPGTLTLMVNDSNYGIVPVPQYTGLTKITGGKIKYATGGFNNGDEYVLFNSAYDTTGSTGGVGLDVTGATNPWFGGLAGGEDLATAVVGGYGAVASVNLNVRAGNSYAYSGMIANGAGSMPLNKQGYGTQTLTGANTYSGATTVKAGTLALGGASGSILNSAVTVKGGTLLLDNSTAWTNRLADGSALSLGSLTLVSSNGAGIQSETVGATTFATGGKITVNNGASLNDQTTLALGAVTRSAGAAVDFVGAGGTLGGGPNSPNVTSTGAWPGAAGGILPWATVGGTRWAEDNAGSIRAYSGAFVPLAGASSAQNAQETSGSTLGAAAAANSLNIFSTGSGTQTLDLGSNNLTLGSAAGTPASILKSGSDAWAISGTGQVRAGSGGAGTELIAHVDGGDLTISAPLNTAIVNIAKGGTGKLILSGSRAATLSGSIGIVGALEFQGSSTTLSGVISGSGSLIANLNPGQVLTISNTGNSYSGSTIARGGVLRIGTAWNAQGLPGGNSGQFGTSNLEINNAVVSLPYYMSMGMGPGPGQFQITGGTAGFSAYGNDVTCNIFGRSSYEIVWGSDYFKPDVFVLQEAAASPGSLITINNLIDLNGATRTISVTAATTATSLPTLAGVIRTSSGTAGIIKTGIGELVLSAANTFNGPVTVNGGTLSVSNLINGGLASGLGASSNDPANILLANGTLKYTGAATSTNRGFTINGTAAGDTASLDASGTGAVNWNNSASPAYGAPNQARTLILAGTSTGNNTLAANIADNGTGAVSVNKTGIGTWVLTGTTAYTGTTTVDMGTLKIAAPASLYGGVTANWVPAKINVAPGATLALNVGGGGDFQAADVATLLDNSHLGSSTDSSGLKSGAILGLDTTNGNFAYPAAVANPNSGANPLTLAKFGANTLTLSGANTYTGGTTLNAGVVSFTGTGLSSSGAITFAGNSTLQWGTGTTSDLSSRLVINSGITATFDTNGNDVILATGFGAGGSGALTKIGAGALTLAGANTFTGKTAATDGTLTVGHNRALQYSALDTTGAGNVSFTVANPTIGGLSGAVDLATKFTTGFSAVTSLTLNPLSGAQTYTGAISDGAAGMSLAMIGAGTQVLQGANTYTGPTKLYAGTLTLSGWGTILNSSGITLAGGNLALTNTAAAEATLDRVHDANAVTSGGGTISYVNTSGTNVYAEMIGSVALTAGQLNVVEATNQAGAGSQTLTLAALTHAGASNSSAITFSAATTGPQPSGNKNMIAVAGAGTASFVGPWATVGTTAAAQTDYAAYNSDYVVPAGSNLTAPGESGWGSSSTPYQFGAAATLSADRTAAALRYTGAAATLGLSAFGLETYGLLNGGSGALTVSAGAGGALRTPAGGGNLYLTGGSNTITITAPITDSSDAQPTTVVKGGSSTVILDSAGNSFSGGIVVNAGILQIANNTGNSLGGGTYNGNIFLAPGATLAVYSTANQTLGGVISGDGSVVKAYGNTLTLSGDNTYTGKTSITPATTAGGTLSVSSFNSVYTDPSLGTFHAVSSSMGAPTTVENGTIDIGDAGKQAGCTLIYTGPGETTDRVIRLNTNANTSQHTINASNPTGVLKFTSPFVRTGGGINALALGGTGSGEIVARLPGMIGGLTKSGSGTWTLDAPDSIYIQKTQLDAGVLSVKYIGDGQFAPTLTTVASSPVVTASSTAGLAVGMTVINQSIPAGHTILSIEDSTHFTLNTGTGVGNGTSLVSGIGYPTGLGLTPSTAGGLVFNGGTLRYTGTDASTNRNFTINAGKIATWDIPASTLTVTGSAAATTGALTKTGGGTLVLSGANAYTGPTSVNSGTLKITKSLNSAVTVANGAAFEASSSGTGLAPARIDVAGLTLGSDVADAAKAKITAAATGGTVLITPTLAMTGSATQIDVNSNGLVLNYDGSIAGEKDLRNGQIRQWIKDARDTGNWSGTSGITSKLITSTTSADFAVGYRDSSAISPTGGTFMGQTVDGDSVLVRYTMLGDSNLDGVVNFIDLVAVAQNYNTVGTGEWNIGDFNYDGDVNFIDLVAVAQHYNQGLPLSASIPGASAQFNADLQTAFATVPEPATVTLLAIGALAILSRRTTRTTPCLREN